MIDLVTPLQSKRCSIYLASSYIHVCATHNLLVQTVLSDIYYFSNNSCNIADIIWIKIYARKDKNINSCIKKSPMSCYFVLGRDLYETKLLADTLFLPIIIQKLRHRGRSGHHNKSILDYILEGFCNYNVKNRLQISNYSNQIS